MSDEDSHSHRSSVTVTCTPRTTAIRPDILLSRLLADLSLLSVNPALASLLGTSPLTVSPLQAIPQVSPFISPQFFPQAATPISPFAVSPAALQQLALRQLALQQLAGLGTASPFAGAGISTFNPFNRIVQ